MKLDVSSETINKLFNSGFEEQILDIAMVFENTDKWAISDIPISPLLIGISDYEIIISHDIYESYQIFLQRINNSDTAGEIPFILLGNRQETNGKSYIYLDKIQYNISDELSDLSVKHDGKLLEKLINSSQYNVISIGHTHGNVAESKKNSSLTRNIPSPLINAYQIRDVGLNLSVADINSHQSVIKYAKEVGNKEILQTVIMYNGDMVILGSNGVTKCDHISALLNNGEVVSIPTGSIRVERNNSIR